MLSYTATIHKIKDLGQERLLEIVGLVGRQAFLIIWDNLNIAFHVEEQCKGSVRGTPVISHVPLSFPIFPVSFRCVAPLLDLIPEYFPETQKLQNAPDDLQSIRHSVRHPFKAHHCTAHSHAIFCVRVVSS